MDGYAITTVHPATVDAKGQPVACRRVYQSGRVEWVLRDGTKAAEPITSPPDIERPDYPMAQHYNVGAVNGVRWARSA